MFQVSTYLEAERTLVRLKWEVHCALVEHFG